MPAQGSTSFFRLSRELLWQIIYKHDAHTDFLWERLVTNKNQESSCSHAHISVVVSYLERHSYKNNLCSIHSLIIYGWGNHKIWIERFPAILVLYESYHFIGATC